MVMHVDCKRTKTSAFMLDSEEIEEVNEFVYLGSMISNIWQSTNEIQRRLTIAREAVSEIASIWKSRNVSLKLELRVLRATAFLISECGSKSWTMLTTDERRKHI